MAGKWSEMTALLGSEVDVLDRFPVLDVSAGAAGNKTITRTELATALSTDFYTKTLADSTFAPAVHSHTFASLTSKPTTIGGYGITDAFTQAAADALYSPLGHTHAFSDITGKPTTVAGYGITDAYTKTEADARYAPLSHVHSGADITSGTIPVARIGTGTPAAGKYVDGGTGAWTTLPTGGGGATTLDELTDVVITSPATGHILRHNGTNFVNALGSTFFSLVGHVHSGADITSGTVAAAYIGTHTHDAADVSTGILATARLGSGTASTRKYLRGDSTWAPAGPIFYAKDYGALGNGTADDTSAIQAAIDAIKTAGGGRLHFEKGTYKITAALVLLEMRDIWMTGEGRYSTIIRQVTANTPAVQCNGLWYSRFEGLRFDTTATQVGNAVFELDGNYDGGTHTLGVQGNTFKDCYFAGNASNVDYLFATVRQGGGSGQGSENLFLNCHFEGAKEALYLQSGLNALNNTFIGGNFQAYPKDGMRVAGGVNLTSVAFQSTTGYTQIVNGGYDVNLSSSAGDRVVIDGCRTESLRFCKADFAYDVIIRGLNHTPSVNGWAALSGAQALDTIVQGTTAAGNLKLYRVTTAGTKGGAEPTWPESGTVADGTITWTQTDFDVVTLNRGLVERSYIQMGQVSGGEKTTFSGIAFKRKDPIANSYRTGSDAPVTRDLYYEVSLSGAITPIAFGTETALTKVAAINIGEGAVVAAAGNSASTYKTLGLYRGHGNSSFPILNWWELIGGIKHQGFTFADFAFATGANGVVDGLVLFCTDGTPGDPLTGSGTGCFAYYANGRWVGYGAPGGGSGSPGGANTQVQFNDSGVFGGDAGLTYNKTTDTLTAGTYVGAWGGSVITSAYIGTHTHDAADITTGILGAARGGTGNGFTAFSGPATSTKTFTLPNASATILTTNAAVTVGQGGTGVGTFTSNGVLYGNGTGNILVTAQGPANSVLTANAGAPVFSGTPRLDRLGLGQAADSSAVLAASGQYFSARSTAGSVAFDFNNGNCIAFTLASGANSITLANAKAGGRYVLELKQPASGSAGTVTWPSTVKWSGGTAPTLTTTNGRTDIVTLFFNGTNFGASALLDLAL